jgi:putative FmdB family regulatory protein
MPTYEYRCAKGHAFELFQKMSDAPVASCPECGAEAQRVLSGGAGFLFKGEGFYITDYRSEDYKKKAQAEKSASGSPDAAPEKPASKKTEGGDKGDKKESSPKSSETSADSKSSKGTKSPGGPSSSGTDG